MMALHTIYAYGLPVLLVLLQLVSCFNLEPRAAIVFTKPKLSSAPGGRPRGGGRQRNLDEGRPAYFGFSVALLKSNADDKAWLMVGAPRANSSMYIESEIIEPGAFYKCDVNNKKCEEVRIDPDGNKGAGARYPFNYHDLKNNGWLGSAIDSQPDKRQATAVCAGRLKNQIPFRGEPKQFISGKCYWLNSTLSNGAENELSPLIDQDHQYFTLPYTNPKRYTYNYAHGQAGMAVHFPEHVDNKEMLIGAPGVLNWKGTVIHSSDIDTDIPGIINRKRRQASVDEQNMFNNEFIPNPYYSVGYINDFDLFGYAVSSGRLDRSTVCYVGGSPRGAKSRGKVLLFQFPQGEYQPILVKESFSGDQLGEYFGGSVAMLDANGDGVDELVVGAPLHSLSNKPDAGKLYYYHNRNGKLFRSTREFVGSSMGYSRFATTVAVLGDLNDDGYDDLAVGAPWENDQIGAVYIYMGSNMGLQAAYSQRLSPDQFGASTLRGFGMALSRGIDIDGNHYPDLGVGSFLSGHAVLLRSRQIASITATLTSTPSKIPLEATSLNLKACVDCRAKYSKKNVNVNITLSLDHSFSSPRATFSNGLSTINFPITILPVVNSQKECKDFDITILEDKMDPTQPIQMKMEYTLIENYDSPEQLIDEPIIDIRDGAEKNLEVSIVTGCEKDGNDICSTDLRVNANFKDYGMFSNYTIGTKQRIPLTIDVANLGEPAFLPNLRVSVEEPLKLYLPRTHNCEMPEKYDGATLICKLKNPLDITAKDELTVNVDVSELRDQKSDVTVSVTADSGGIETNPSDNSVNTTLKLHGKASLQLLGYSRDEQLTYHINNTGFINTTSDLEVHHIIQILKKGPTPISNVELNIDIPTNFSENSLNFLQMEISKAEFGDQQVICSLEGVVLAPSDEQTTGLINSPGINNITNQQNMSASFRQGRSRSRYTAVANDSDNDDDDDDDPQSKKKSDETHRTAVASDADGEIQNDNQAALQLTRENSDISYAKVKCPIGPWLLNSDSFLMDLRIKLNLTLLAQHMPKLKGAVLTTHAKAVIRNNELSIEGDSEAENVIRTTIIPNIAEPLSIPWWYILLAILAGILLLGLVTYALYKSGFFQRKKKDEMKAQKATVNTSDTANLVEN